MTAYRFEDFELDSARYELRRDGRPVRLERRALDLLIHLVRNRDRVVPKDEILAQVWKDVVVNEHSVEQAVYSARRALGDHPRRPRVIETVRGRGLRFVADVTERRRRGGAIRRPGAPWPPFVGRAEVLAHLEERLREAAARNGRLVLLSGEPGIGKTRVTEEFVARVRQLGGRAHVGRCPEDEGAPAFWPWVQLLRAEAAHAPPERIRELFRDAPHLAAIAPGLAPSEGLRERLSEIDPGPARFALFDALTRFWCASAREEPRVLVLEDLHRADEASWILLGYLAREIAEARVLVIGTFREAEMHRDPMRRDALARMQRDAGAEVLPLGGLDDAEVRELLDRACDAELAEPVVLTLRDRSGGNPFFLARLLELVEEGDQSDARALASSLPRTLREAIARQLDGLPAGCRHLLTCAAVIGREFPLDLLTALLEDPSPLERDLAAAVEGGLVTGVPGDPGAMAFGHALVRDALYDDLTPATRARLHARVVVELEQGAGGEHADDPERLSELAHHCLRAVAILGPEPAIESGLRAGRAAAASLAFEEAVEHFSRALAAGDAHGITDSRRCDLLLGLGEAQTRSGRRDAARETFTRAAALAKRLGASDRLAHVALAVAPGFFSIEVGVTDPFTVSLLEDALALVPRSDPALRARLLARLAMALYWSEETHRIEGLLSEAEELASASEDRPVQAFVLCSRVMSTWDADNLGERLVMTDSLVEASIRTGLESLARVFRIAVAMEIGDRRRFDADVDMMTRTIEHAREPSALWYPVLYSATRYLHESILQQAEDLVKDLAQMGFRMGDANVAHSVGALLFSVRWHQNRSAEVLDEMHDLVARFPRVFAWRCALALLSHDAGRKNQAAVELDCLMEEGVEDRRRDITWLLALTLLGDLCAESNASIYAPRLYRFLAPYADRLAVVGYGVTTWGAVSRVLGRLALLQQDWDLAQRHLEAAAALEARFGAKIWLGYSLLEQGKCLFLQGRSSALARVAHLVERAHSIGEVGGAVKLTERAKRLASEVELYS